MTRAMRGKEGEDASKDVIWMGNGEVYDGRRKGDGKPPWQDVGGEAGSQEDQEEIRRLREKVDALKKEGAAMKEVRRVNERQVNVVYVHTHTFPKT